MFRLHPPPNGSVSHYPPNFLLSLSLSWGLEHIAYVVIIPQVLDKLTYQTLDMVFPLSNYIFFTVPLLIILLILLTIYFLILIIVKH
jgi:hypothetical protein